MADELEKYPPNIQKLFQPKPPFPYVDPLDYPPEKRRTQPITPISQWKNAISKYVKDSPKLEARRNKNKHKNSNSISNSISNSNSSLKLSKHLANAQAAKIKKQSQKESFARQLRDWNDPELFEKHEREVMKDPYRTVFIARLDYSLTELDVTQHFQKYGIIESIKIIRDREGKSRGYGFIVFENEADANTCVNKTSRLGVKLGNRTALVDIERSRILRNWKPRRLGGGEGGRNHVKEGRVASAAATGRRVNIANNPHNQQQLYKTSIESSRGSGGNNLYESGYGYQDGLSSYTSHNSNAQWSSSNHASGYLNPGEHQQSTSIYSSYQPSSASVPHPRAHIPPTTSVFVNGGASSSLPTTSTTVSRSVAATNASPGASVSASIRDKYAKYSSSAGANNQPSTADKYAKYTSIGGGSNNSSSQQSASRSIRSIRRN